MSLLAALALSLSGCGYNDFQRLDEQTKSAWSEVLNQYQRARRPDPQHRRDRQGRDQLRAGDADPGGRGPREGDLDPGHAGNSSTTPRRSRVPGGTRAELSGALSRSAGGERELPATQGEPGFSRPACPT
ncbi:hypothetical protein ACPA9J_03490 [Pseudomonas aeruginosa]